MSAVQCNGVNYSSVTAALAALKNIPEPQLVVINGPLQGADAFGSVSPGPLATVVVSGKVGPNGELPTLAALGTFVRLAWGKAIINVEGVKDLTIQNLRMIDAATSQGSNGAAIRIMGNPDVVRIKNVIAERNENGILGAGKLIIVEDSLINNNGWSTEVARRGYSHNIYFDGGEAVEIYRSTIKQSEYGHDLKSRAKSTLIVQTEMSGSKRGRAFDLANGGRLVARHSIFRKAADAGQNNLVDILAEGNPDGRPQSYLFENCLFDISIEELARELQYVLNRSDFEVHLVDCDTAGPAATKAISSTFPGKFKITRTAPDAPLGPQLPVGRQGAALAMEPPAIPLDEAAPAPAPVVPEAPALAEGRWVHLAMEQDYVTLTKPTKVRYGVEGSWVERTVEGVVHANNGYFGSDPQPGATKVLQKWVEGTAAPTAPAAPAPAPAVPGSMSAAIEGAAVAFCQRLGYTVTK